MIVCWQYVVLYPVDQFFNEVRKRLIDEKYEFYEPSDYINGTLVSSGACIQEPIAAWKIKIQNP